MIFSVFQHQLEQDSSIVTNTFDLSAAVNAAIEGSEDVVVNVQNVEGESLSKVELLNR